MGMFFSFFYRFVMFKACNSQVCDNHQARQLLRPSRALPRQQGRPSRLPSAAISPAAASRPRLLKSFCMTASAAESAMASLAASDAASRPRLLNSLQRSLLEQEGISPRHSRVTQEMLLHQKDAT